MGRFIKPDGVFIQVTHFRRYVFPEGGHYYSDEKLNEASELSPRGGVTAADICDMEGNLLVTATAVCSDLDNYNKRIGRDIAVGRALKELDGQRDLLTGESFDLRSGA